MLWTTSRSSTSTSESGFVKFGKGDRVTPEERWEARVMEQSVFWGEYGLPIDPHKELPMRDYKAHLAIIEGKKQKRKEERKSAKNQSGN